MCSLTKYFKFLVIEKKISFPEATFDIHFDLHKMHKNISLRSRCSITFKTVHGVTLTLATFIFHDETSRTYLP